jgi:NADH-ubiquinone oxidoreductase chain 6
MLNLFFLNETISNGLSHEFFFLISVVSILCGIFVIISKNPIVSVLFLIGLFLTISLYLILLGINFIGLSYLLVYVGAVSILFLFILMLINIRVSELITDSNNSIPLAILVSLFFSLTNYRILPLNNLFINSYTNNILFTIDEIFGINHNYYTNNNIYNSVSSEEIYLITSNI